MTAAVPPYLDAMLDAHAAGHGSRSIHLGYWPRGGDTSGDFAAAQARLDDLVIDSAALTDGLTVLDVACGLGGLLAAIDARFRWMDLTGVNHDPRQLDPCHRVRPRPDTILRWVEADACRLPFADASFDRVFCIEAMFHFGSREAFLREAFRVLKPDGRLVVTDILLEPPADAAAARAVHADLLAAYGPWPEPWTSPGLLHARLAAAGFVDVKLRDITAATLPSYGFLLPSGGGRPAADPLGRSLAALHRLHAGGGLIYGCASGRRPRAETAAERLVRTAAGLGAPLLHERSLRIAPAGVGGERFLLSLSKPAISGDAAARLAAAWRDLGMPAECLAAALEHLPDARHVHFGYEGGPGPTRLKVYLEFAPNTATGAGLLHLAFKWDPTAAAPTVVTRYLLHPPADRDRLVQLIATLHDGGATHPGFVPLVALIDRALARMSATDVQVLEVIEETGRRSYDVNVSDAGLPIGDVRQELEALGRAVSADADAAVAVGAARAVERGAFTGLPLPLGEAGLRPGEGACEAAHIPCTLTPTPLPQGEGASVPAIPNTTAGAVDAALSARAGDRLGHVAGGVHRDGLSFITIYHGAGPWPPPPPGAPPA